MYRTGDVGRLLPDGRMEFVGRRDEQVKVRGHRVELGEIEAVLRRQAGVAEAAVVARQEAAGEQRLVAYVVTRAGAAPSRAALRAGLRAALPDYMVPSAFAVLDRLPLTSSGKVDRRALPEPEAEGRDLDATYASPRTTTEEVVAVIWTEVLRVEKVGIHNNFFDLGGHSLLATQVMARLRQAFGVAVPLRALFEVPTVAGLAERVETVLWSMGATEPSTVSEANREEIEL
jgi:acyl carrier protein